MRRALPILISLLLLTAGISGCFGGDGDKDNDNTVDPDPTDNGGGNNTTAPEPNLPPIANYTVGLENGTTDTAPFFAKAGNNLTIMFDASGSSDPDGNITAYVWTVSKEGIDHKGNGPRFNLTITDAQSTDFGLYSVILRIVDDDFNVTEVRDFFALSYEAVFDDYASTRIVGPGTESRSDTNEDEAGAPTAGSTTGTFTTHTATIVANATKLDLHLEFTPTLTTTNLKLFVFKPGDDHATAEPLAQSDSQSTAIDLSVTDLNATGKYTFRVELDGQAVDTYILTAKILYAAPAKADEEA